MYSLLSIAGFVLIVWGYGQARLQPMVLWPSPTWTRHLAALLTIPAFVLLVAAYVPRNAIKARLHHPMVLGVKVWALAHLLANNTLADLLLFGGFLAWSVASFTAARKRDNAAGTVYLHGHAGPTVAVVVVGRGGLGRLRVLGARRLDRRAALRLGDRRLRAAARSAPRPRPCRG